MTFARRACVTAICLGLGALAACSPKPPAPPPAPAPVAAAPAPAPPPARHAHMICRSSRDGRPIPCGTSDAVMVGIKED